MYLLFAGLLNGASQKADTIATFHVGETATWLQKVTLIPGGWESLIYTTLSGSVGVLVPFTSHEDHDFFQHLEMHMRNENPPLCGRDHLSFRSYYFPVKVGVLLYCMFEVLGNKYEVNIFKTSHANKKYIVIKIIKYCEMFCSENIFVIYFLVA